MSKESRLTDCSFNEEVLNSKIPVLVDFWASWCPPCKMMEPILEELRGDLDGKVKIAKINVDQNPKTEARYDITGVPTFIIFNSGKVALRCTGAQSKQQLKKMLQQTRLLKEKIV